MYNKVNQPQATAYFAVILINDAARFFLRNFIQINFWLPKEKILFMGCIKIQFVRDIGIFLTIQKLLIDSTST